MIVDSSALVAIAFDEPERQPRAGSTPTFGSR